MYIFYTCNTRYIYDVNMKYRDSVRDLCFIVDRELSVFLNIKQLTRKCYCKRRDFRNFSRPLSCNAPDNISDVFLTSRMSHCGSILAGFPLALLPVSTEISLYFPSYSALTEMCFCHILNA